jgi:hypothetical protein
LRLNLAAYERMGSESFHGILCSLLLCWSCRFLASRRVVSLRARLDDCWRCLRCSRTLLRSFSLSSSICCRQRSMIVGIGAPPSWVVHSRWPKKPVANLSRSRRTRLLRWSTRQLCTIPSVVQWYLVGHRDRGSLQLRANGSRPHRTVQASLTSIAQLDLTANGTAFRKLMLLATLGGLRTWRTLCQ